MPGHFSSKCEINTHINDDNQDESTPNQQAMLNLQELPDTDTDNTIIITDDDDEWLGKSLLKVEKSGNKKNEIKKLKKNTKDIRKRKYLDILDTFEDKDNKKKYTF